MNPRFSLQLTFNESHILIENIGRIREKTQFLDRLRSLSVNTTDICLKNDLLSLCNKIEKLTDDEFQRLRMDVERTDVLFPPNYSLPSGIV